MTLHRLEPANPPETSNCRPAAPLLPAAIGLIVGIAGDDWLKPPPWILIGCVLAGVLITGLGQRLSRRLGLSRQVYTACGTVGLLIAMSGLGSLRHASAVRHLPENHIFFFTTSEPRLLTLRARILTPINIHRPGEQQPSIGFTPSPGSRFIAEALSVAGQAGDLPACGRVAVRVHEAALDFHIGDVIRLTGWLEQPAPPRNPGGYDWAKHHRRNGIFASFAAKFADSVRLEKESVRDWRGSLQHLRSWLSGYLVEAAFEPDEPGGGVVAAMVLAQRSAVSRAVNEAFVRTGTVHFLAASGMNVAWLIAAAYAAGRLLGLYYRTTAVLVILFILSYLLLAEPEPSILRAGIAGLLWCGAVILRGHPSYTNWLAGSAIVILLVSPTDVFRPAFQLSFVAVLGLMHLTAPIRRGTGFLLAHAASVPPLSRILDYTWFGSAYEEFVLQAEESRKRWILRGAARFLHTALAASLAAWLATLPLTCYHFNQFTPWGWLATLLLILPAFLVTLCGYLLVSVGLLIPPIGWLLAPLLNGSTRLLLAGVSWLDAIPGTVLDGRSPSLAWVLAAYAVCGLSLLRLPWRWWAAATRTAVVLLLLWWMTPPRWFRAERDALHAWVLSVGHGQAVVLELPRGRTIICDFGSRSAAQAQRAGLDLLRTRGITRVDAVFVSHPNLDHYNAIPALADRIEIGELVVNDWFTRHATGETTAFLGEMARRGIPVRVLSGPCRLEQWLPADLSVLWPPAVGEVDADLDANESSTVLRVACHGHAFLIPGDVGPAALTRLVGQYGNGIAGSGNLASDVPAGLRADVLILPHHGAVVTGTRSFLAEVDPAVVIRSTGQSRRLTATQIEDVTAGRAGFNTADDGCIQVTFRRDGMEVRPTGAAAGLPLR